MEQRRRLCLLGKTPGGHCSAKMLLTPSSFKTPLHRSNLNGPATLFFIRDLIFDDIADQIAAVLIVSTAARRQASMTFATSATSDGVHGHQTHHRVGLLRKIHILGLLPSAVQIIRFLFVVIIMTASKCSDAPDQFCFCTTCPWDQRRA
jgi:hypothetical protein